MFMFSHTDIPLLALPYPVPIHTAVLAHTLSLLGDITVRDRDPSLTWESLHPIHGDREENSRNGGFGLKCAMKETSQEKAWPDP